MKAVLFNGERKSFVAGTYICISDSFILNGDKDKIDGDVAYDDLSPEIKDKVDAFVGN
jgi:hypothetical protein